MNQQPLTPLDQQILSLLKTSDRNQGELKDLTDQTYPVLYSAIVRLQRANLVEHYFTETTIPVLTYRLVQPKPAPVLPWLRT